MPESLLSAAIEARDRLTHRARGRGARLMHLIRGASVASLQKIAPPYFGIKQLAYLEL